ncbi:MAG: pentapeptide repeat-containing protein [Chloroflexi bacterium]|nr:pentapeptide repeat-containing protein [Chloroflexota bacterium]
MGNGTKESPYTREDVLTLIEKHGGTTQGLDLSGKWFEKGIKLLGISANGLQEITLKGVDLRGSHLEEADLACANLEGAILWEANLEGANLGFANLKGANLLVANLKRCYFANANLEGADLGESHLEHANLFQANLEGANLWQAHFESAILVQTNMRGANLTLASLTGACLVWAQFSDDTEFAGTDWGDYILGEERNGDFTLAKESYWRLRHWHTDAGLYDIAGEFFFREMTARRKAMKWWPNPLNRAFSKLVSVLCGYGEKPERTVVSAIVIIFGLAIAYHLWGYFTANASSFWDKLYYSAVSFTAVGYGNWAPQPTGWAKGAGVVEAFLGVFMMALFLVTFTRKMTR